LKFQREILIFLQIICPLLYAVCRLKVNPLTPTLVHGYQLGRQSVILSSASTAQTLDCASYSRRRQLPHPDRWRHLLHSAQSNL